jgi:hypothetical protein
VWTCSGYAGRRPTKDLLRTGPAGLTEPDLALARQIDAVIADIAVRRLTEPDPFLPSTLPGIAIER